MRAQESEKKKKKNKKLSQAEEKNSCRSEQEDRRGKGSLNEEMGKLQRSKGSSTERRKVVETSQTVQSKVVKCVGQ